MKSYFNHIPYIRDNWGELQSMFTEIHVPPKTTLLREGEIASRIYFINQGCLRLWFNDDGRDITFQFFFEQQEVSSFESFYNNETSLFNIETVEFSHLITIEKENYLKMFKMIPQLKEYASEILAERFVNYTKLFLSRIKDSPQKRYMELCSQNPQLLERVPHHYIASYLGITSVSLSRIRNRISSDINNG
ncbi:Crp/Fnr family transcriptional regulator [Paenibacillus sp. FSL K6-2524]|uniref:Crp/Fnr family transcriptional regulator n=1 Tax=Paenibacillus sp. FSL K6-2524 TaxID=2954516 RepID=UPI0030F95FF8